MKHTTTPRGLAAALLPTLLFAALIAAPHKVHADSKSATVSLVGLDLSTDQGLQAAHDRVRQKARWLCDRVVDPWTVSHQPDYVRCVDETTATAVRQLEDALVAAHARPHIQRVSAR